MEFIVVADTHLGVTNDKYLWELEKLVTAYDIPVIWLGDTFDTLRHEEAYSQYKHLVKSKDIWIAGNHDYAQSPIRALRCGDIFLTHGDLVDFGWVFARLQQLRENTNTNQEMLLIERILCPLRKWTLNDVYNLYTILYSLTDSQVISFERPGIKSKLCNIFAYVRVLCKLLRTPTGIPTILNDVPYPDGEKMGGYATHDPEKLLRLTLLFYPEARSASTIIVGHTHHPIDSMVTIGDKQYRFITLGAWVGDVEPTYAQIKEDSVTITHI